MQGYHHKENGSVPPDIIVNVAHTCSILDKEDKEYHHRIIDEDHRSNRSATSDCLNRQSTSQQGGVSWMDTLATSASSSFRYYGLLHKANRVSQHLFDHV